MQFTFVIDSNEGENKSYLLCFIPCPVWKKGNVEIKNLHPENPHFEQGDLRTLYEMENLDTSKHLVLIVHSTGHGSNSDLENIMSEINILGIKYSLIRI